MSQAGRFVTGGGGGGSVSTLTGNSGGAVGPTAGNINVVGSGVITVTGNPGTSTLTITSALGIYSYTNVNTSPYVVLNTDEYLGVDCSGIPITIELPNAPAVGRSWTIKDRTGSSSANNITVTTVGGVVNIDGAATYIMSANYSSINVIFDGTAYQVY